MYRCKGEEELGKLVRGWTCGLIFGELVAGWLRCNERFRGMGGIKAAHPTQRRAEEGWNWKALPVAKTWATGPGSLPPAARDRGSDTVSSGLQEPLCGSHPPSTFISYLKTPHACISSHSNPHTRKRFTLLPLQTPPKCNPLTPPLYQAPSLPNSSVHS